MVKNSAVVERETKVEGSTAGVGMLSTKLYVARVERTWRTSHRNSEVGKHLSGTSSHVK